MMEALARAWLGLLPPELLRRALCSFDARRDWHYRPRERPGIPLREMDAAQAAACWRLVESGLSTDGRAKAHAVLALERTLGELEGRPLRRDPGNYALALFGEPQPNVPWAWRFEGHHLSLTYTVMPSGDIAVTPAFFGANPAVVPDHLANAGSELMAPERALGFELLNSLAGEARARCVIAAEAPADILTGPGSEQRLVRVEGIPFADLTLGQRDLGWRLVEAFVRHLPDTWRSAHLAQITEAGLERLTFGWAGGTLPSTPHYFRLHGPTTVIEYDNVQNGANHVHAVWHDLRNMVGDDQLRRHHRDAHGSNAD